MIMVIGIGGASRSGKSTLAALLFGFYTNAGHSAIVLAQDDFVFPVEEIPRIHNGDEVEIDWEIPEAIDFQRYQSAIAAANNQFDYVITEGLLNFYDAAVNSLIDKFLFVAVSKTTFLSRKADDKRWGEVPTWYVEHIWASYERLGKTVLNDAEYEVLVLSGEIAFDRAHVLTYLQQRAGCPQDYL